MNGWILDSGVAPDNLAVEIEAGGAHVAKVHVQAIVGNDGSWAGLGILSVCTRWLAVD